MPRHTCGPVANVVCNFAFARRGSNRSGSANSASSRLADAIDRITRSPRGIATPASSRLAVAYRSSTAAAGSMRSDSSIALSSRTGSEATSANRPVERRWWRRFAIIPSVVSMPPNRSTAAFDVSSSRDRAEASPSAAARRDESPSAASSATRSAPAKSAYASRPSWGSSAPALSCCTALTMRAYQPRMSSAAAISRPRAWIIMRAASGPASCVRSSTSLAKASIRRSTSRVVSWVKRSRIASRRKGRAKGVRCRMCSAPSVESMLGPVIWPVVKRGSSTVRPTSSRIAARLSSRVVIIHPLSAGTQTTGPTVRSRASVGWGSRSRSSTVTQSADGTRVFMRAA